MCSSNGFPAITVHLILIKLVYSKTIIQVHYTDSNSNKISANNLVWVIIGYSQMIVSSNTVISDWIPAQTATYS